jgi:hypothetical protein
MERITLKVFWDGENPNMLLCGGEVGTVELAHDGVSVLRKTRPAKERELRKLVHPFTKPVFLELASIKAWDWQIEIRRFLIPNDDGWEFCFELKPGVSVKGEFVLWIADSPIAQIEAVAEPFPHWRCHGIECGWRDAAKYLANEIRNECGMPRV